MFVFLLSHHTVFHIQFEINLHFLVFQTTEIALVEAAPAISAFWKTHLTVQINSKLKSKLCDYLNTYHSFSRLI